MARPNRFNPRSPIQDLQRRERDGLGGRPPEPEERRARTGGNQGTNTTAATGIDWAAIERRTNTFGTELWEGAWNRNNTEGFTNPAPRAAIYDQTFTMPQGRIDGRDLDDFLVAETRMQEAVRVQAEILRRELDPFRQVNLRTPRDEPAHTRGRRNETPGFRIARASRFKTERHKPVLIAAMAMGLTYQGKLYRYELHKERSRGVWLVGAYPVAEVDLDHVCLVKLMLPKTAGHPSADLVLWNKTRFLWRILGVKALRYKDKTVVSVNGAGHVMMPGEDWNIHPGMIPPYVTDPSFPELKQGDLFGPPPSSASLFPRCKPTDWINGVGQRLVSYFVPNGAGTTISLNNPPRPTEEDS